MANTYNSQLVPHLTTHLPSKRTLTISQDAFTIYHEQHDTTSSLSSALAPALPALGHALSGSIGTAISNLSIYPLDLIITRLQVQRSLRSEGKIAHESEYNGVIDAFDKIYNKEGGIKAFYTGVWQDTGKSIVDSFLFFLFYNYLRTKRLNKNGIKSTTLPALEELIVGALAGACSKFFTTPIANVVTRKQTASLISARASPSSKHVEPTVADIYNTILKEKGIQGFWSGYSASLVLTLNPSLTFFLYEFFKRTTLPRSQREHPGARTTFLMAAFAKACASTVTYPFSLAKARAQASSEPPVSASTKDELKSDVKSATEKDFSTAEREEKAKAAARKAKAAAKKNNVFTEILRIYREDGAEALYEGVYGEILKGFFSHGITMLVKESIHKLIIKTYFAILKALNKIPNPKVVVEEAKQGAENVVEKGKEVVNTAVAQGQTTLSAGYEKAGNLAESGKEVVKDLSERAGVVSSNVANVADNAKDAATSTAKSTYEQASAQASNVAEKAKEVVNNSGGVKEAAKDTAQQAKNAVTNTSSSDVKGKLDDTVQKAGEVVGGEQLKSQQAGHLLSNAQEQLGDAVIKTGKGIKGEGRGSDRKE